MRIGRRLLSLILASGLFTACSSTTIIRSTDPEAKIYVDGELKGRGSYSHSDTKVTGSVTQVRLEKPGCPPQEYRFSRNEKFDWGACLGGLVTLVPFLWIKKYRPEHVFDYRCSERPEPAESEAPNL
jgi:hypothetical protein